MICVVKFVGDGRGEPRAVLEVESLDELGNVEPADVSIVALDRRTGRIVYHWDHVRRVAAALPPEMNTPTPWVDAIAGEA